MVSMRKILLGVCAVIIGSIVIISLVGTGKIRTPLSDYSKFVDTPIADGEKLTINLSIGEPKPKVVQTSTTGTLQELQDFIPEGKKYVWTFIHNGRVIADYNRPLGNYGIKNGDTVHYLLVLCGPDNAQIVYVKVPGDDGRKMKFRVGGSPYESQIKKTVRTELGLDKDYPMDLLPGNTILKDEKHGIIKDGSVLQVQLYEK
eukprot:1141082_1